MGELLQHNIFDRKRLLAGMALAGILLFGLTLRVSYLREIMHNPAFSFPQIDAGYHDYWARALVTGDWEIPEYINNDPEIRTNPYIRPPGYPFFLALVYYLCGSSYLAPRLVQMGLGLLNCVLAYFLGKALFGRATGLISAAFMSFYWVFIYFEGELLAPVLLVTLALLLIHVLHLWYRRPTLWRALSGGVLLGVSALVRPNILIFLPAALGWSWWVAHRRHNVRHIGMTLSAFLVGALMAIAPATIRNYIVAHDLVIITSNAGLNLYIANNEQSDGVSPKIPVLKKAVNMDNWTNFDYSDIVRKVGLLQGKKMRPSEVSSYFTKKAIDYTIKHPGRTLRLLATKAALFWGPVEVSCNEEISYERLNSPTLRHIPGFPMALSLGIVGIMLLFLGNKEGRKEDVVILILLFIVTYFISYLPFVATARYRVPIIPFLFLFGAYGLYRIFHLLTSRNLYGFGFWVIICILLYILAGMPIASYRPDLPRWHFSRACAFRCAKRLDMAIKECREAIRLNPDFAKAYIELGNDLFALGKIDEAIDRYSQALYIRRDYATAHNNLGVALAKQGKVGEAIRHYTQALRLKPDSPETHTELANLLMAQGEINEAIHHYTQALRIRPDFAKAHNNLGLALAKQGAVDEAIRHYTQALRIRPDSVEAHNNLGNALFGQGRVDEAIRHYTQALRIRPDSVVAHNNLKKALATQREMKQAIYRTKKALRLNPKNPALHYRLGNLHKRLGQWDKAIEQYQKTLAIQPSFVPALSNLAMAYTIKGKYAEAISLFSKVVGLQPDNVGAYYNIACIYARQNKAGYAVEWLKKAISKGYNNWELLKNDKDLKNIRGSSYYQQLIKCHREEN